MTVPGVINALTEVGITDVTEVVYNPSYETLFEEETRTELEGYEKGVVTELGAVAVDTGIFTGRSPKDTYIVRHEASAHTVDWDSPNCIPMTPEIGCGRTHWRSRRRKAPCTTPTW